MNGRDITATGGYGMDSPFLLGVKLLAFIAAVEFLIMMTLDKLDAEAWMSSFAVILTDTLVLSATASLAINYWLVRPQQYAKRLAETSRALKEEKERAQFLAYYDFLTGLPNRTFFKELLENAITYAARYEQTFALLYLDLDDFKRVNDSLGHDAGDVLLQAVSERLRGAVRKSDDVARLTDVTGLTGLTGGDAVVFRMGGDEFVILLRKADKLTDVCRVTHRILKGVSKPIELSGHEVFVSTSIGVCMYPTCGKDADSLLKNADTAMYHAKALGKNNYQFYTGALNKMAVEFLDMERDLHRAIEREELLLYYQPIFDAASKRIAGMEALLRWEHKERGLLLPAQFIPLAEDTGLIVPLGERALFAACLQASAWRAEGFKDVRISVNLSARQLSQKNLASVIERTLIATELPPQNLELEITESAVMQRPEEAIAVLNKLKAKGVGISIDDFGTGYSSLNYLRRLPVDYLKIDRSFVMHAHENDCDAAIIKGIIALAHGLNLKVVAEGVETEGQFEVLRGAGCDEVQGFLFGRPMPAEESAALLREEAATAALS